MKNRHMIKAVVGIMGLMLALNIAPAQKVQAEETENQETVREEEFLTLPDISEMSDEERMEFEREQEEEMLRSIRKDASAGRVWLMVNNYTYNPDGSIKEHTDYTHNDAGDTTGIKRYTGDVLASETQYTFDANGNRTGSISTYYNTEGRVRSVFQSGYDANGNQILYTSTYYNEDGSVTSTSKSEYEYDANGNRTKSVSYYNDELNSTTYYAYDGNKETRTETYDETGSLYMSSECIYEGDNLILKKNYTHDSEVARMTGYTRYTYDANGNETEEAYYSVSSDGTERLSYRSVRTYVQRREHFYQESYFSYDSENAIRSGYAYERAEDGRITKETYYTEGGEIESYTLYGAYNFPGNASAGTQTQRRNDTYDNNNNLISYEVWTYQLYVYGEETDDGNTDSGDTSLNGLILAADGNWYYYVNGSVNTGYTGLAYDANVGWWYVENGKINFAYNGLIFYNGAWWCVAGGQVRFDYTGLWSDPTVGWWYVNGGAVDFGAYGLVANEYGWWYVNGGAIDFGYTGLAYDANVGWWYVNGGAIDFGACGLVANEYGWWYVNGGAIDFGASGLVANEYGWWYVNGGAIDFGYTGLAYDANVGWWYVENGAINFGYTGSCTYNGATYQVVNGAVL